jgi:hypothetical protein
VPSITFTTPGPVRWTIPPNVISYKLEAWGSASAGLAFTASASFGGGGAEYACEPSLPGIPGITVHGFIAHGGRPGNSPSGGATTWNSGQVTANGGVANTGGKGSSNTIHFSGGNGGAPGAGGGGGGGGASAGPSGAGANGAVGGTNGGAGGAPAGTAGRGGHGGASRASGANGGGPGGGGGGAGFNAFLLPGKPAVGGYGAGGQIRITWQTAGGSPQGFPLAIPPVFPAGYQPGTTDLNTWLADPFAAIENRPVARFRQTISPQSLPASGVAQVIAFDVTDEDPLQGWDPSVFAWIPPPGWSGCYAITVTLCTLAVGAGNVIRPGIIAPGSPGVVGSQQPGSGNDGGAQGSFWVYLVGGQDAVQATGTLLNAAAAVNTGVGASQQTSMDITWISL